MELSRSALRAGLIAVGVLVLLVGCVPTCLYGTLTNQVRLQSSKRYSVGESAYQRHLENHRGSNHLF